MSNKNETDLYVNVHGLEDMKALNSELEHSFNLLTGIVEHVKYLRNEDGIDQDAADLIVKKIAKRLTQGFPSTDIEVEKEDKSPFAGITFNGKPVSKDKYMTLYEDYVKRCSGTNKE